MTEEVVKGVYRITVPLPNNPLKYLNAYFIRGRESNLLIDTGFDHEVCRNALLSEIHALGCSMMNTDILLTHLHGDHSGLAGSICAKNRKIYISRVDWEALKRYEDGESDLAQQIRYRQEGTPETVIFGVEKYVDTMVDYADPRVVRLEDHAVLTIDGYEMELLLCCGHTPGNCMLWLESEGIMFTSDHILFSISPNIIAYPYVDNSLKDYIDSLKRVYQYPVRLALPGHRETSVDYRARIAALINHHRIRLSEVLQIIKDLSGLTGYQIATRMSWSIHENRWESFPSTQKWFASGECFSHLDYLLSLGLIERRIDDGQIRRYYPKDRSLEEECAWQESFMRIL